MADYPGYVCATCGAFHAELPLCYGSPAPYYWDLLSEEEQAERGELTADLCVIDQTDFLCEGISRFLTRGPLSSFSMRCGYP